MFVLCSFSMVPFMGRMKKLERDPETEQSFRELYSACSKKPELTKQSSSESPPPPPPKHTKANQQLVTPTRHHLVQASCFMKFEFGHFIHRFRMLLVLLSDCTCRRNRLTEQGDITPMMRCAATGRFLSTSGGDFSCSCFQSGAHSSSSRLIL